MRVVWAALLVVAAFFYAFVGPLVFDVAYWVLGKVAQVRANRRVRAGVSIAFVVVYFVAVSLTGSTQPSSTGAGATSTPLVAMATASPSASPTAAATASPTLPSVTPSILSSPSVTPSPGPTINPHDLTVANVTQSLHDNAGLETVYQNFDALAVTLKGDTEVDISVKPAFVMSEVNDLDFAGGDALIASKAIFGWYPTVLSIQVTVMADYQDAYGNVTTLPNVTVGISIATAAQFNYAGMAQMDPIQVICDADTWYVHPGDWNTLSTSDRGCLKSASSSG
jgi:hypothetical protein